MACNSNQVGCRCQKQCLPVAQAARGGRRGGEVGGAQGLAQQELGQGGAIAARQQRLHHKH